MDIFRFNPTRPIPNDPFYFSESYSVSGVFGPTIVGDGLSVNYAEGTLNATGGNVTGIIAGLGISVSSSVGNVVVSTFGVTGTYVFGAHTVQITNGVITSVT